MKTVWRYAMVVLCLVTLFAEGLPAQTRFAFSELHMGVEVRMVMYAPDDGAARSAARAAFDRIAGLEQIMSDYRPKSEMRLVARRPREWVPVSEDLFRVLARAVEVASASEGAFDPTVGPVVALWREARRLRRLPGESALRTARARVGWQRIALDSARRRVRLATSGMRLDLGGIAKGDIVQQAAITLRERGIASALVEAGGDIAVSDAPPGQRGWRIETSAGDTTIRERALALTHAVISTSGPSAQFVEIGGTRYSHVVDPRTGVGLTSSAHATVIADDGALADALSTALTVVGAEGAARLLARYPGVIGAVEAGPPRRPTPRATGAPLRSP